MPLIDPYYTSIPTSPASTDVTEATLSEQIKQQATLPNIQAGAIVLADKLALLELRMTAVEARLDALEGA